MRRNGKNSEVGYLGERKLTLRKPVHLFTCAKGEKDFQLSTDWRKYYSS